MEPSLSSQILGHVWFVKMKLAGTNLPTVLYNLL